MTQKVLYMTYKVIDLPVLTFVARQKGEAWNHPFVCVYEPSSDTEPGEIASVDYFTPSEQGAVGIIVKLKMEPSSASSARRMEKLAFLINFTRQSL